MKIDLSSEILFKENEIDFEKKINFIFGKNGTGKSTISKLLQEQNISYDLRLFQGFESVIGENNQLNAVILGEENKKINDEIRLNSNIILQKNKEKEEILRYISPPEDKGTENLWSRLETARNDFIAKEQEIKGFFSKSAAIIKNKTNPQIANPSYNTNSFQQEINRATLLQDVELKNYENILGSQLRQAKPIDFPKIDLGKYLRAINEILESKVLEKKKISRLEDNNEKRNFAERGLHIHKKGELCAFCGNAIDDEVFNELESYFSADEVRALQERISSGDKQLDKYISSLEKLEVKKDNFYPDFIDHVLEVEGEIQNLKQLHLEFLSVLKKALKDKASNLFSASIGINIGIPDSFEILQSKYDEVVNENNNNDLYKKQLEAKNAIRYHEIKKLLDGYKYDVNEVKLTVLKTNKSNLEQEFQTEELKIQGVNGIDQQIAIIKHEITILESETRNEKKLADNINKKLKNSVSFELEHCESEKESGFYKVKCVRTGTTRDITQLSTGEKNIIAFLYFVEKLNEVNEDDTPKKSKIIVFDDPMNSNDDTMQYLIIDELQKLMKQIQDSDKFILLTHNNHFYLNVKYGRKYKTDSFIRLLSNGKQTEFKLITKEDEDYKTNYEALWNELAFLCNNEQASPEMLLNPIRRIIETYTKFNGINKNTFYENQSGAKKLFDVNSHSIDDLEADLNGKTKQDIIRIMEKCFEENGSIQHYTNYRQIL